MLVRRFDIATDDEEKGAELIDELTANSIANDRHKDETDDRTKCT